MSQRDRYQILQVSPNATQAEIKQAYRRLAKQLHPDSQHENASHEEIVRLNDAYEILGDPQRRRNYDRQCSSHPTPLATKPQRTSREKDTHLQAWMQEVYIPVQSAIDRILNALDAQIDDLAADPFDDELMEAFQNYLDNCRQTLNKAQRIFTSQPNPAKFAATAANLYYCLNHISDGLEEMEWFGRNYDEHYLHSGKELFRRADRLRSADRTTL
ncbi:MAG: J domain-containing protein [Cyanobacteria bacterium SBLK]|nr:J domain-containing protein [Cyanobacteria bacterium SBLK]